MKERLSLAALPRLQVSRFPRLSPQSPSQQIQLAHHLGLHLDPPHSMILFGHAAFFDILRWIFE
jgi:hypothetical protein